VDEVAQLRKNWLVYLYMQAASLNKYGTLTC
jgi:hypothetical protein